MRHVLKLRHSLPSVFILASWREKGEQRMDTVSTVDLAATPVTLKAIGVDADGRPISLAGKNPTWAFDPADIVEVNLSEDWTQAVLTRKTAGTVTVTVTVNGMQSPLLSVQVHEPELVGVAIQVAADASAAGQAN